MSNLPSSSTPLRPYLGSQAHLSLSWLSQSLLSLILISITLTLLLSNINHLVLDGKEGFVSSCQGVQGAANVLVSLPHYMADGVNELNRKSVSVVTEGAAGILDLALISVEEIVLFMIDTYRSLFLCLLNLVVHGSLDLLIAGTAEAEAFIKAAFQDVRTDIQASISLVNTGLDDSIKLLDKLPGVHITPPHVTIPALNSLNNVHLPTTILTSIQTLNSSLPTLASLRDSLDSFISTPINTLRTDIKTRLANATISVGDLPVPSKSSVSLCGNLNTSFIDDIGVTMSKFIKISLGLLFLAAILLTIFNFYWERYRWNCYLASVNRAKEAWSIDMSDRMIKEEAISLPNLLSFLSASHYPRLSLYLTRLAKWKGLNKESRSTLFWFGAYIFHPMALIFLMIGTIGLLVVKIQLGLLQGPIKSIVQTQANAGVGDFSNQVFKTVNDNMNGTSIDYATHSNRIIQGVQDGLNHDLFNWVNVTTKAMNHTLNEFYSGLTTVINSTFHGTPLDNSALDLIYCLVGSKVHSIESALTFISDNSHITLPLISPSVLLLSTDRTKELTSTLTSPNSTLSTTSIVDKMINRYDEALKKQRLGFLICILIWFVVVLMGLMGVWWRHGGELKWENWKKERGNGGGRGRGGLKPFHLRSLSRNTEQESEVEEEEEEEEVEDDDKSTNGLNSSSKKFNNFVKNSKFRGKDFKNSVMKGVKGVSNRFNNNYSDSDNQKWTQLDASSSYSKSSRTRISIPPTTSFSSLPLSSSNNNNEPYISYPPSLTSISNHPVQLPLSPPPIPSLSHRNPFGSSSGSFPVVDELPYVSGRNERSRVESFSSF